MAGPLETETHFPGLAKASEAVRKPYFIVFVMLAIITVFELQVPTTLASLGLLKWQQIGILIATAAMKASLVALYYMHLKYEPLVLKWVPVVPLVFVAILVVTLIR